MFDLFCYDVYSCIAKVHLNLTFIYNQFYQIFLNLTVNEGSNHHNRTRNNTFQSRKYPDH
jgi:hypothetical protein